MKKFALAAVAALALFSCSNAPKGGEIKDDVDSLIYANGMGFGMQIKDYATQMGIDSAYFSEVVAGFEEGVNPHADAKQKAHAFGVFLAYQMMEGGGQGQGMREGLRQNIYGDDSTKTINWGLMLEGFHNAALDKSTRFDKNMDTIQSILQVIQERIQTRQMEKQYGEWKAQNDKYLQKIAADKSYRNINGVYVKELTAGTGAKPTINDKAKIAYVGKLVNDSIFDDSSTHGGTVDMPLSGTIPGFAVALAQMPVGAKWVIVIPQEMGYGVRDMGQIKPFSTLVFEVELKDIVKGEASDQPTVELPEAQVQ